MIIINYISKSYIRVDVIVHLNYLYTKILIYLKSSDKFVNWTNLDIFAPILFPHSYPKLLFLVFRK